MADRERFFVLEGSERAWVMRRNGMGVNTVMPFPFDGVGRDRAMHAAQLTAAQLNETSRLASKPLEVAADLASQPTRGERAGVGLTSGARLDPDEDVQAVLNFVEKAGL